jgi:hypothetical protein
MGAGGSRLMPAMGRRVSEVGARRCVVERGLCVRDQQIFVGSTCVEFLRLQVEVWDLLEWTCLLSAEGLLSLYADPTMLLRLEGADRVEVVCPAFSAASRDPVQRRFASIDDYFRRPEGMDNEGIWVRVYVRDEKRSRQALLWDASILEFECMDVPPDDPMRPHLPEGSRRVEQADSLPLFSPALPGQALNARVGWYMRPEAGQEGVAEADKMWWVAGGDEHNHDDHDSFFYLQFDANVGEAQLVSVIRDLLESRGV